MQQDCALVPLCAIMLCLSHLHSPRSEALAADTPPEKRSALLQCTFLFSLVWSVGANTDGEGRAKWVACSCAEVGGAASHAPALC
jgi:hypothetical protein